MRETNRFKLFTKLPETHLYALPLLYPVYHGLSHFLSQVLRPQSARSFTDQNRGLIMGGKTVDFKSSPLIAYEQGGRHTFGCDTSRMANLVLLVCRRFSSRTMDLCRGSCLSSVLSSEARSILSFVFAKGDSLRRRAASCD